MNKRFFPQQNKLNEAPSRASIFNSPVGTRHFSHSPEIRVTFYLHFRDNKLANTTQILSRMRTKTHLEDGIKTGEIPRSLSPANI